MIFHEQIRTPVWYNENGQTSFRKERTDTDALFTHGRLAPREKIKRL